jgi:hypothetical protein
MTNNNTVCSSCNTNQKQDLDCLRDISCNTLCHERNISTMTHPSNKPMKDSTSSTSNEFGTMTKINFSKNAMKETSSEAKNEFDIGVMTNNKVKNNLKNSESNTLKCDSEMGINCNMNDIIFKKDSTCDAKQFEQQKGINTNKHNNATEFSTMTINDAENEDFYDMNASKNENQFENTSNNDKIIDEQFMSERNAMNNNQLVQLIQIAFQQYINKQNK